MKKITIADVADHAKVSKSTVSQYLNKRYSYMSENTRLRIKQTVEDLNYRPNSVARSLKNKTTFTVGIIVANIVHGFSTQVIRAIEDKFRENGFHIIVCNADDEPEKEKMHIEMLLDKQIDGLIIFPTGGNMDLYIQMKQQRFPVVFIDRKIDDIAIPSVMLDNIQASKLAVDWLVEGGHTRIAFITASVIRNISPRLERIQGYKDTLESHGLCVNPAYIKTPDIDNVYDALKELFVLDTPPKAIIAGNDRVMIEVLRYVKEHHLRIPEDVAVIGFDELDFASFYTPSIATIGQPTLDIANLASKVLLNQINGIKNEEDKVIYRLPPSLNNRESR